MVLITEALVRKKSEHNECLIGTLEELSLHQEDIERIEHLQNWCRDLRILLLQSNLISKIENLHKLKRLEYLNLALNNIEIVENLEGLESLKKLDFTLNFIGKLTSIESLRGNYNLEELILTGNPCQDYPNYREYVIATLPQLKSLDGVEITPSQRIAAGGKLKEYRDVIVCKETDYVIERDEQRIRYAMQKTELEEKMAGVEDEEERIKMFWDSKSENCPEIRSDISKYHRLVRGKQEPEEKKLERKVPQLFAPCGRPYNLNQAKLKFLFKDEVLEYILELYVYRYLDTSLIDVDVQPKYVRVTIKGKIFQLAFTEEVNISESSAKRSQTTGNLELRMPKLNLNETLTFRHASTKANTTKDRKKKISQPSNDVYKDLPPLI